MAVREIPAAVGVKVTEMVQFSFEARVEPQSWVTPKSDALVPETLMEKMANSCGPVLLSVIVWGELVVPTTCLEKVRLVGEAAAFGGGETLRMRLFQIRSNLRTVPIALIVLVDNDAWRTFDADVARF